MRSLLAMGACLLAAASTPASSGLSELQASAKKLSEVALDDGKGEGGVKVEAVRRRIGALAALAGAARPILRSADLPARLQAHLALAEAHEAFAKELFAARPPSAAKGESVRGAWADQLASTVERSLETARAHLRSCVDLATAAADREAGARCAQALQRVGAGKKAPRGNPAAVVDARVGELQGCFDAQAAEAEAQGVRARQALELTARLSVDGAGRVEEVALSPRREDARALYDCLADGLWIWTFPGVADVELELPLRLSGPR